MHPCRLHYEIPVLFREKRCDWHKAETCPEYSEGGGKKIRSVGHHQPASFAWPTAAFREPLDDPVDALHELSVGYKFAGLKPCKGQSVRLRFGLSPNYGDNIHAVSFAYLSAGTSILVNPWRYIRALYVG